MVTLDGDRSGAAKNGSKNCPTYRRRRYTKAKSSVSGDSWSQDARSVISASRRDQSPQPTSTRASGLPGGQRANFGNQGQRGGQGQGLGYTGRPRPEAPNRPLGLIDPFVRFKHTTPPVIARRSSDVFVSSPSPFADKRNPNKPKLERTLNILGPPRVEWRRRPIRSSAKTEAWQQFAQSAQRESDFESGRGNTRGTNYSHNISTSANLNDTNELNLTNDCYTPPDKPIDTTPSRYYTPCPLPSSGLTKSHLSGQRDFEDSDEMQRDRKRNHQGDGQLFQRPEWVSWDSVKLYLRGLPKDVTTLELWQSFKHEGNVDDIDIFISHTGLKDNKASLTFRPPPRRDFFTSDAMYTIVREDGTRHTITVRLDRHQRKIDEVPNPANPNFSYPEKTAILTSRIDFGVAVAPETMLVKQSKFTDGSTQVRMILNLYHREIEFRFTSRFDGTLREYKFRIQIDQELGFWQTDYEEGQDVSFILSVASPPQFYRKMMTKYIPNTHDSSAFQWRESETWLRQTHVLKNREESDQIQALPVAMRSRPEGLINLGRWLTYRITVSNKNVWSPEFRQLTAALRDYNVQIRLTSNYKIVFAGDSAWPLIDATRHENVSATGLSMDSQMSLQDELHEAFTCVKNDTYLTFDVFYQLAVCISNGCINEYNIDRPFLEALSQKDPIRATQVLEIVAINKNRVFNPMDIFKIPLRWLPSMKIRLPDNYVMLRTMVITPTTMVVNTPSVEMMNRVFRKYRDHTDRFLRIRFEDDPMRGYSRIQSTKTKANDGILNRVHFALRNGVKLGDRLYEFLAFGNSQLREHSAYFFAPIHKINASHIRAWMGQFNHERIPAKFAARMGQCFSTTTPIRHVPFQPVHKKDLIKDVIRNGYNFTDGVGKISGFYVDTIARELAIRGPSPSVLQFRMAGCKGVLATDSTLKGMTVALRESQHKFEATYSGMEIIRWSQYWVATLNRQLIYVYSALGVPDEVFLEMQEKQIRLMEDALVDDSAAKEALTRQVDPNRMTLMLATFVEAGFRGSKEPFVTSLIHLWRAWSLKYLKEKARLTVTEGAFVLGCTDETGTLQGHFDKNVINEDDDIEVKMAKLPEIFMQITEPGTRNRKIIEGLCTVARNPSLHAGDIRVVRAVNVPALHHLVDVVVFPQTGDRDIAGMCSGGDLDGDDFSVIWDKRLLPPIWDQVPMDYTPPPPKYSSKVITKVEVAKVFVQYIKNDFLGQIANAHQAWADFLDEGVRHETCQELAALHSKAVDYPKTGQAAEMSKKLRAKRWPHFMEKKRGQSYISKKINGQLYDAVERVAFVPKNDDAFDERILNACEPDEKIMEAARALKVNYDISMQRIMTQHDIKTEFEVWATFVLDHSKGSKDYKFHEEIGELSSGLRKEYYAAVIEQAGGHDWGALLPWAVAMYRVTRDEVRAAIAEPEKNIRPFISFPWILQRNLRQIAKGVEGTSRFRNEEAIKKTLDVEPTFDPITQLYDDPYQPPEEVEDDSKELKDTALTTNGAHVPDAEQAGTLSGGQRDSGASLTSVDENLEKGSEKDEMEDLMTFSSPSSPAKPRKTAGHSQLKATKPDQQSNLADLLGDVNLEDSFQAEDVANEDRFRRTQSVPLPNVEPKGPVDHEDDEELFGDPIQDSIHQAGPATKEDDSDSKTKPVAPEEDSFRDAQSVPLRRIERENPDDQEDGEEVYEDPLVGGMNGQEWD